MDTWPFQLCLAVCFRRIVYTGSIGFNMGRQLDELCFFFWRPAIYVTLLCYCSMLLANKLMMMWIKYPRNKFAPNSQGRRVWFLAKSECHCQRSEVKVTRDKNAFCIPITPRQRRNGMHPLQITSSNGWWDHSFAAGRVISAACVRFMFGKTSLALVITRLNSSRTL